MRNREKLGDKSQLVKTHPITIISQANALSSTLGQVLQSNMAPLISNFSLATLSLSFKRVANH